MENGYSISLTKVIEIPDESEKSPVLLEKKEEEVDSAAGKEEKEKEAGNGDGGKEKEAEEASKEKEEKDKTSEMEKDTPAEVKAEGSDGKNTEGEACVKTFHSVSFPLFSVILTVLVLFQLRGEKMRRWTPVRRLRKRKVHTCQSSHTRFAMKVWRLNKLIWLS